MVRIDKDNFVADKFVFFDVVGIDRAIEWFVKDDYSPIKGIDIFATFPYCGHQWNLFLLESYCRRFSEKFRFETIGFNSKNVGVVVRKNCLLSYTQIMADAVAKSETLLEKDAVEKFLYDSGFINRSSYANTLELIEMAKTIRE